MKTSELKNEIRKIAREEIQKSFEICENADFVFSIKRTKSANHSIKVSKLGNSYTYVDAEKELTEMLSREINKDIIKRIWEFTIKPFEEEKEDDSQFEDGFEE